MRLGLLLGSDSRQRREYRGGRASYWLLQWQTATQAVGIVWRDLGGSGRSDEEVLKMDQKEYDLEQSRGELDKLVNLSANQADEASCKSIAEKAETVYKKYPTSEEIALAYA